MSTPKVAPLSKLDLTDIVREVPEYLSFSKLNTYHDCGEKYRLSYIEKVPREAAGALIGGIAVHETIQLAEREDWWLAEDALESLATPMAVQFRKTFDEQAVRAAGTVRGRLIEDDPDTEMDLINLDAIKWGGRGQSEDYPWWMVNGPLMLQRYAATRRAMVAEGWGVVEGGVEMKVIADLPGVPIPLIGYLDKFLMHEGGEPLIVDYKTGKVGNAEPFQFATYAAMIKATRGIDVTRGSAIFLRSASAESRVQPIEFELLIPRMAERYANLAKMLAAGVYDPNPRAYCSGCGVRDYCWYWKGTQGEQPLGTEGSQGE